MSRAGELQAGLPVAPRALMPQPALLTYLRSSPWPVSKRTVQAVLSLVPLICKTYGLLLSLPDGVSLMEREEGFTYEGHHPQLCICR